MPRVVHFQIPADKPERAIKFYEAVFGWKTQKWDGPTDYWMVTTGQDPEMGIDGAIAPRDQGAVTTNTIGVSSVDEYSQKVQAAGGKVLMPKMPIPGMGWFAVCADSEGNPFAIMQPDPATK
jgi:uncharacterized protein